MLDPDDVEPGMLVTVLNGPIEVQRTRGPFGTVKTYHHNRGPEGIPYRVLAVDLPFIAAEPVCHPGRYVLDVRDVTLMRCSLEYAQAFSPRPLAAPPAPKDTSVYPWTMFQVIPK